MRILMKKAGTGIVPTGTLQILGTSTIDTTLTADISNFKYITGATLEYQWYSNGTPITGATNTTFTLTAFEAGETITLTLFVTDSKSVLREFDSVNNVIVETPVVVTNDQWFNNYDGSNDVKFVSTNPTSALLEIEFTETLSDAWLQTYDGSNDVKFVSTNPTTALLETEFTVTASDDWLQIFNGTNDTKFVSTNPTTALEQDVV